MTITLCTWDFSLMCKLLVFSIFPRIFTIEKMKMVPKFPRSCYNSLLKSIEQKIKPIRIETDGTKKHKKKLNTTQNSTDRIQKTNKQQIWRIALSLAHRRGNFSLFVSYISSIVVYQKHIYVRGFYEYMYTNAFERLVAAMGFFVCRCVTELQLHRVHNENLELCIAICQCILG